MKKKTRRWIAAIAAAAVLSLLGWALVWGNTALVRADVLVCSNGIPEAFDAYRIVQISDLHDAQIGENNEKLIAMTAETEPDCIVLTGDFVDSSRFHPERSLSVAESLVKLAPVYYVSGNHEAIIPDADYQALTDGLRGLGVCVLEDESAELTRDGQSIRLIGLTDIGFHPGTLEEKKDALRTALSALLPEDEFSVTLAHRPELMDVYTECGAPLVLSGHAHGGQIRLPGIGGLIAPGQGLFPKYTEGKYEENGTTLVVSRGIGNSVLPLRVNDRPQIVVVQLACNYRM